MDKNYRENMGDDKWSLVENQNDVDTIISMFPSKIDIYDETEETGRPAAVQIEYDGWGDYTPTLYIRSFGLKNAQELIEAYNIKRMWRE